MIQLPKKTRPIGKRKVLLVPSDKPNLSEFGLFLPHKDVHDFIRFTVLCVTDDIPDLKNSDEVIVNIKNTKMGKISGWSDEFRSLYSIQIYSVNYDDILAVIND